MADIKTCIINGKTYSRIIYKDGTRIYHIETKRITNRGRQVIRTITTEGTQRRIDAELAGGMDTVKEFLRAWLTWAEDGAVVHGFMDPQVGLCSNSERWAYGRGLDWCEVAGLRAMLIAALPRHNRQYPFGGEGAYVRDTFAHSHHTNEKRLAWVRGMLK